MFKFKVKGVNALLVTAVLLFLTALPMMPCTSAATTSNGWDITVVDARGDCGVSSQVALDKEGHIHIAYFSGGELRYATDTTGSWVNHTIDVLPIAYNNECDIAVDDQGIVHIVYFVNGEGLKYAFGQGTGWTLQAVTSHCGGFPSITLGMDDSVHLCFYGGGFDDGQRWNLVYAEKGLSGWNIQVVDETNLTGRGGTDLVMDLNGTAHIAYSDQGTRDLKYAEGNATGWTIKTLDSYGDTGDNPSIALDSRGHFHITYEDSGNDLKYLTGTLVGWTSEVLDTWSIAGSMTSVAVGPSDDVHISYYGGSLKYVTNLEGEWQRSYIDSSGAYSGFDNSLAIDRVHSNRVVISYYDYSAKSLKVAISKVGVPCQPYAPWIEDRGTLVKVSWQAPNYDGGSPLTAYTIYRHDEASDEETSISFGPDTVVWSDTEVLKGHTYDYSITASNANGESARSTGCSILFGITAPWSPQNLTVGSLDQAAILRWDPPLDDGGSPITAYQIFRGADDGDPEELVGTVRGDVCTYLDKNILNDVIYTYEVRAQNYAWNGTLSMRVGTIPGLHTVPSAPLNVTAQGGDRTYRIAWDLPATDGGLDITCYKVSIEHYGYGYTYTVPAYCREYVMSSIVNGVTSTIQVWAVNTLGEGERSPNVTATTVAVNGPPSVVGFAGAGVAPDGTVNLFWVPPYSDGGHPILSYRIYMGTTPKQLTWAKTVPFGLESCSIDGLDRTRTYFFQIAAVNEVGEGGLSNMVKALYGSAPPTEPVDLIGVFDQHSVHLSWSPPEETGSSDIIRYEIFRNDVLIGNASYLARDYWDADGLTNGTATYHLRSVNAQGASKDSIEASVEVIGPPVPLNLVANVVDGNVSLAWTAPSGSTDGSTLSYRIYRGLVANEMKLVAIVNSTSYLDTPMERGIAYFYEVAAVEFGVEGEPTHPTEVMVSAPKGTGGAPDVGGMPIELIAGAAVVALVVLASAVLLWRRRT